MSSSSLTGSRAARARPREESFGLRPSEREREREISEGELGVVGEGEFVVVGEREFGVVVGEGELGKSAIGIVDSLAVQEEKNEREREGAEQPIY